MDLHLDRTAMKGDKDANVCITYNTMHIKQGKHTQEQLLAKISKV